MRLTAVLLFALALFTFHCGSRPASEDRQPTSDGGLSEPEPAREPETGSAPGAGSPGTEDFSLRWKLAKGDSLRYRVAEDLTIKTKTGLDIDNLENLTLVYRIDVRDVVGGSAQVEVTYESFALETHESLTNTEVKYDSTSGEKPRGNPLVKCYAQLMDRSFTCEIDAMGQVSDVRGTEALRDAFMSKLGMLAMFQSAQFASLFSPCAFARNLSRLFAVVPAQRVGVGDRWTSASIRESALLAPMHAATDIVFAKTRMLTGQRCATCTLHAKVETETAKKGVLSAALMNSAGAVLERSDEEGVVDFALDRGRLIRRSSLISIDIRVPPIGNKGIEMYQEIRIRTRVDLLR